MKILHTSDWHLGRMLYGRQRTKEFSAFLDWLLQVMEKEQIDVLLVAGDVFDTTTPSYQAQALYYEFLSNAAQLNCRHIVIIGGNHDSPALLNAPQDLLKALRVHVIGRATEPNNEVITLYNDLDEAELIVCAIPYLREQDVRTVKVGESIEEKANNYIVGVTGYYRKAAAIAKAQQEQFKHPVPVVAMGHLFTVGGHTLDDDGVRDLIVGGLGHIHPTVFDSVFNYVALGHLHVPQRVGKRDWVRYSGSPIPMGFGEANQQKSMCLVELKKEEVTGVFTTEVALVPVPIFQKLKRIQGDWWQIKKQINFCKEKEQSIWLEIIYTGDEVIGDLREQVLDLIKNTSLEAIRIQNQSLVQQVLHTEQWQQNIDEFDPIEMFKQCLQLNKIPKAQWDTLLYTYQEALDLLHEDQSF